MTEERMIRVVRDMFYEGDTFDDGCIRPTVIDWLRDTHWEELEPAPPKDWRPVCFYASYPDKDKCVQYLVKKNPELPNVCIKCPYRKTEALK